MQFFTLRCFGPAFAPVELLPLVDVAIVLGQAAGKDVGAVVSAHEVEIWNVCRSERRCQTCEPG